MIKCKIIHGSIFSASNNTDNFEFKFNDWLEDNPNIKIINEIKQPDIIINSKSNERRYTLCIFYQERVNRSDVKIPVIPKDKTPGCPTWSFIMTIRANNSTGDLFFGCCRFPSCRGMRPFVEDDWKELLGEDDPGLPKQEDIPF